MSARFNFDPIFKYSFMKIYQQTIMSDVMNFATNEMHHKCGIWNIFPNKNEQGRKERMNKRTNRQDLFPSL